MVGPWNWWPRGRKWPVEVQVKGEDWIQILEAPSQQIWKRWRRTQAKRGRHILSSKLVQKIQIPSPTCRNETNSFTCFLSGDWTQETLKTAAAILLKTEQAKLIIDEKLQVHLKFHPNYKIKQRGKTVLFYLLRYDLYKS